jgi:hypothetical protein
MDSRPYQCPERSCICEQNLKTDAIDIAAKKSKLVHQVLEATISTDGDSRRMADINKLSSRRLERKDGAVNATN